MPLAALKHIGYHSITQTSYRFGVQLQIGTKIYKIFELQEKAIRKINLIAINLMAITKTQIII